MFHLFARGFSLAICLATLLLASPAAAGILTINEDYTIGFDNVPIGDQIEVRGDAKLTIASPEDGHHGIASIKLFDTAKLEVQQGQLRGTVYVLGTNEIDVLGGTVTNPIVGPGNADVEIHGGLINLGMQFSGGTQRVLITDGFFQGPIRSSGDMQIRAEVWNPRYSLTGNGTSVWSYHTIFGGNEFDFSFTVGDISSWSLRDPALPDGDANRDGVVDLADLNAVRNRFGRTFAARPGDYDWMLGDTNPYDGKVDLTDLNRIRNNFGASQPIPEPSSLVLLALSLAGVHVWHRRPRRRD